MKLELGGILAGERLAIARALSAIENARNYPLEIMDALYPYVGRAYRVGITGPPGAGKSTLTDGLITLWRRQGHKVGVISVDPTSPFTGGAILGDRVRMSQHASDQGVFIRSMASRGSLGGLALRAQDAADVLDAAGWDLIVYETVGVGQVELDVAEAADTTLVVLVPEAGDDIQAMKAGLLEVADILVLNKADRQGAERAFMQLQAALELRPKRNGEWQPKLLRTSALKHEGLEELVKTIEEHRAFLEKNNLLQKRHQRRLRLKIEQLVGEKVLREFWTPNRRHLFQRLMQSLEKGEMTPRQMLQELLAES